MGGKSFSPEQDIPDLSGKVILVTGGNSGLGASSVKFLAAHNPGTIFIGARTRSTAQAVIDEVHTKHEKADIKILDLDLSKFDSVKECARQFNQRSDRLDILMLNGGISSTPPSVTVEGYERQWGTNYMGHALLTQLLMPTLLKTANAGNDVRIASTSSIGALKFAPKGGIAFDDIKTDMKAQYGTAGMGIYGHSKLAQILFAKKMAQAYPQITSTSLHPGTVQTPITRGAAEGHPWLAKVVDVLFRVVGVNADEGCKNQLWCATGPKGGVDGVQNGEFYMPVAKTGEKSKYSEDEQLRDKLWEWTDKELKEHGGPGWPAAQ